MARRFLAMCLLTLSLGSSLASALPKEVLEGAQQAVSAKLDELVRTTLDSFFKEVGQEPPQQVDVGISADFDMSKPEPVITQVKLAVTLTSDLPPEVVRQARQELVRAIKNSGYRTDPGESGETPLVNFTIDSQPIDHSKEHNGMREYIVFGTLVTGAIFFSVLAINIILWGVLPRRGSRKKRQPKSSRRAPAAVAVANGLPAIPVNYWSQTASDDLPPLPIDGPKTVEADQGPKSIRE